MEELKEIMEAESGLEVRLEILSSTENSNEKCEILGIGRNL